MRTLIPRRAWTCCSDPMSYVFQRFSVQMMHCSGVAEVCASARLANCVAILFSRSEEHTSELQSLRHLVCRLLLDSSPTEIYTLSLHDALPIFSVQMMHCSGVAEGCASARLANCVAILFS